MVKKLTRPTKSAKQDEFGEQWEKGKLGAKKKAEAETKPEIKPEIKPELLKRTHPPVRKAEPESVPVSQGPVDAFRELVFNPTHDKIRELTYVDHTQARLFPLVDMVAAEIRYIIEIGWYRWDKESYKLTFEKEKPVPPDLLETLLYSTAQWQRSRDGKTLERATDVTLAEMEQQGGEEGVPGGADAWKE